MKPPVSDGSGWALEEEQVFGEQDSMLDMDFQRVAARGSRIYFRVKLSWSVDVALGILTIGSLRPSG